MARKLSESTKIILGIKPSAGDMIVRQQIAVQKRQAIASSGKVFGDVDSVRARQFGHRVHLQQEDDGSASVANDETQHEIVVK